MPALPYLSGNDRESIPDQYSPLVSGHDFMKPPAIPVSTHRSVPISLASSIPEVSLPPVAYHLSSSPLSSPSNSRSESSSAFEDHTGAPSSAVSSPHASNHNPFDCEFGHAHGNSSRSASLSTAATSLDSSQDQIQPLPVSLPISDPAWIQILADRSPNESGGIEQFSRTVMEDSRRVGSQKEIRASREHNRLADLLNEPLTPIPNRSGLMIPLGYHDSITSISQINEMPLTELDAWLMHYGIQTAPGLNTEGVKQRTLARHVGVVTPNTAVRAESTRLDGSIMF